MITAFTPFTAKPTGFGALAVGRPQSTCDGRSLSEVLLRYFRRK